MSTRPGPARVARATWRFQAYAAPFARPLDTARGPWLERRGWWVALHLASGLVGLGEVAPLPGWGTETHEAAAAALARLEALDVPAGLTGVPAALARCGLDRHATPAAYAGAELALLDLLARRAGLPLARLLADGGPFAPAVPVNGLIGSLEPAHAARAARALVLDGFETLKLKLSGDAEADVARARAVREAVGFGIALRLDANGAWAGAEAARVLRALAPLKPAYVEQPTPSEDPAALGAARRASGVPVAADEAAHTPAGLAACLAAGIDAVVLKPMALGGLLAARQAIALAQGAGVAVTLASVLDRGVGTAGVLHLAASEVGLGSAGLATSGLFAGGPALAGLVPRAGAIVLAPGPGLGLAPCDPALAAWLGAGPC